MRDPIPGMSIDRNSVDGNLTVFVFYKLLPVLMCECKSITKLLNRLMIHMFCEI